MNKRIYMRHCLSVPINQPVEKFVFGVRTEYFIIVFDGAFLVVAEKVIVSSLMSLIG